MITYVNINRIQVIFRKLRNFLEYPKIIWMRPTNRDCIPRFTATNNFHGIDIAAVRHLKLSGLFDEARLPWPRVVMSIGQLGALGQRRWGRAVEPATRQQGRAGRCICLNDGMSAAGKQRDWQHRCYRRQVPG